MLSCCVLIHWAVSVDLSIWNQPGCCHPKKVVILLCEEVVGARCGNDQDQIRFLKMVVRKQILWRNP